MPRKPFQLDERDLTILDAILKLGGKVSAEQLAGPLGMQARTLRHRIQRLKQEGYLKQSLLQTNDVKLGLGDAFLFLQMSERCPHLPVSLLERVPVFYDFSPSYGRYNGYCIHLAYSIAAPDTARRICEFMKAHEIVSEYSIFDNVDVHTRPPDFEKFDMSRGWNVDWKSWATGYEKKAGYRRKAGIVFDTGPTLIDFDVHDLALIAFLKEDASTSMRRLSKKVGLSASQTARRIARLEDSGVIKGRRWATRESQQPLYFNCVFETKRDDDPLVTAFAELPIPLDIFAETTRRFCVRLHLEPCDLVAFLGAFQEVKSGLRSFFFQTQHDRHISMEGVRRLYDGWNPDTKRWEIPIDDCIEELAAFAETID